MIISRTPFRVSLFGGGSDYPAWFQENGGSVLGFTINKYCYISLRELPPFFEHKFRIAYSEIEMVKSVEEIEHPAVRFVLQEMGVKTGLEIHHDGDLPARSGLGSSSCFTVGLINALYAFNGQMISKRDLANKAINIEQNVIRENVGSQDQIWAAHGGINRITFHRDSSFTVEPLIMSKENGDTLNKSLMLFFTGVSRTAEVIAKKKIANLKHRENHIRKMVSMVDEVKQVLGSSNPDFNTVGNLLHESWSLKRELADGVTNKQIDEAYYSAIDAGAVGGKVLGAGGGGFMVFYVHPEKQKAVAERLKNWLLVKFNFDMEGSKILVFDPIY